MATEMTNEELDALADRLLASWWEGEGDCDSWWRAVAREAARWAQECERERLAPLRVAVEALDMARKELNAAENGGEDLWAYRNRRRTAQDYVMYAVNDFLEQTE